MSVEPKVTNLSVPALSIDDSNPFATDPLNRQDSIENLSIIIQSTKEPLTLAVDAKWGSGKTTYIELWKSYLDHSDHLGLKPIYVNSWETDFTKEPLIPILEALLDVLKKAQSEGDNNVDQLVASIKKYTVATVKSSALNLLSGLASVHSGGIINIKEIVEQGGNAESIFNNFEYEKKSGEEINSLLGKLVDLYGQKLVVFIDELDRCRPTYSIELLERIKHFLQVENVTFVLSLDKEQLAHSIRAVYGNGFNADNYLDRFFDLTFALPEPDYLAYLFYLEDIGLLKSSLEKEVFQLLMNNLDTPPTFREINRIVYRQNITKTLVPEWDDSVSLALLVFDFLKEFYPLYYLEYFNSSSKISIVYDTMTAKVRSKLESNDNSLNKELSLILAVLIRGWIPNNLTRFSDDRVPEILRQANGRLDRNKGVPLDNALHQRFNDFAFGDENQPIAIPIKKLLEFSNSLVETN